MAGDHDIAGVGRPGGGMIRRRGIRSGVMMNGMGVLWGALLVVAASGPTVGAFEVQGLAGPESFIVDRRTGDYFISNATGDPGARDDNGFVTKLDGTGRMMALKFIDGSKGAPLHAPKGLAIVGDYLFVADIDHVKGYDTSTGRLRFNLDLTPFGATWLTDLTRDAQGTLYVSDRESNFIAKIEPMRGYAVTVLVEGPQLGRPTGLAVNPMTQRLVMVNREGGVYEVGPAGTLTPIVTKRVHPLDGVEFDDAGRLYCSSLSDGVIYTIVHHEVKPWKEHLATPADIGIDRKRRLLLVPSLNGHSAMTIPLDERESL